MRTGPRSYARASVIVSAIAFLGCSSSTTTPVGNADAHTETDAGGRDASDATHPLDGPHTDGGSVDATSVGDGASDAPPAAEGGKDGSADGRDAGVDGDAHETGAHEAGAHDAGGHEDAVADAAKDGPKDAFVDVGVDAGLPALRYIGRTLTDGTSPDGNGNCTATSPCYEWSGTQVVARFTGATAFSLTMSDYGSYFDVYIDGVLQSSPVIGSETVSDYEIASGLTASATHEVSLYKRTEASANGRTQILGYTFPNGGTLLPPAAPSTRRIEVIGDSISCGYGVLGPNATCTETSAYEDHDDTYGALTARSLDADLYTIASSGRGMYRNNDGTTTGTLPDIYGLTLPYGDGTGGFWPSEWSFPSWTPDVVVIDLGTNDFYEGDPGTGYQTAYTTFLTRVLANYPDAWIFCTNGPMLSGTAYTEAATYIQAAVGAIGNTRVTYLPFPTQSQDPSDQGCDGHPDPATHQAMATQLSAAIAMALGW